MKQGIDCGIGERFSPPDDSTSFGERLLYQKHLYAYEQILALTTGKAVLEIGCGTGYGTRLLSEQAKSVLALDIDAHLVEALRLQSKDQKNLTYQSYDGMEIPAAPGSFDCIISFQVIEHVDDDLHFLREIKRVLRHGGVAVLTTPNRLVRLLDGQKPFNNYHYREYSPTALKELAKTVGFEVQLDGVFGDERAQQYELTRVQKYHRWHFRHLFQHLPRAVQMNVKNAALQISKVLQKPAAQDSQTRFAFHRKDTGVEGALDLWLELRHP